MPEGDTLRKGGRKTPLKASICCAEKKTTAHASGAPEGMAALQGHSRPDDKGPEQLGGEVPAHLINKHLTRFPKIPPTAHMSVSQLAVMSEKTIIYVYF